MLEDRAIAASGGGTGQIRSWSQEGAVSCRVFAETVGCAAGCAVEQRSGEPFL